MTDVNFVIPISGYSGIPVNDIVDALLTGTTVGDVCLAFQSKSGVTEGYAETEQGFLYDYLYGLLQRYPDLLESVNTLREDNGKAAVGIE